MSMKSFLIRKLAVKMMVKESVIENVINHQFISALDATMEGDDVEISGFGKFLFNYKKALKKYEKELSKMVYFERQLSKETSPMKITSLKNKLENTRLNVESLRKKINKKDEYSSDLRRLEEQAVPNVRDGGEDSPAAFKHVL